MICPVEVLRVLQVPAVPLTFVAFSPLVVASVVDTADVIDRRTKLASSFQIKCLCPAPFLESHKRSGWCKARYRSWDVSFWALLQRP